MIDKDPDYVYHGSHELFDAVVPRRNIRSQVNDKGEVDIVFVG